MIKNSLLRQACLLISLTIASIALGLIMGNRYVLPLLNGLVLIPFMMKELKSGRRNNAFLFVAIWGLCLIVAISIVTIFSADLSGSTVIGGISYEKDMTQNIISGQNSKHLSPSIFIYNQYKLLIVYLLVAFVSAGILSSFYAAYLLNFMGYYIGTLFLKSDGNMLAWSMGFHPWSIFRAIAFILIGVIVAEISLSIFMRRPASFKGTGKFWLLSFVALSLDVLSKTYFGPGWYKILSNLVAL